MMTPTDAIEPADLGVRQRMPSIAGLAGEATQRPGRVASLLSSAGSVLIFSVLAILSIWGASLTSILLLRDFAIEEKKRELDGLSSMLAEDVEQKMYAANLVLNVLSDYAAKPALADQKAYRDYLSGQEAHRTLVEKVAGNPIIDVATFVAANGDVMNFTRSFPPAKINLADRDYFVAHAARPGLGTHVSVPVHNRGNGKWVFYISRRIDNPQGQMLGLVLVGVSVEVFSDFYRRIGEQLGAGASITLYRDDLTLLTRWPMREELVGRKNPSSVTAGMLSRGLKHEVLFADFPRMTEGGEAQRRLMAPRMVQRFPFIVTPGMTEEAYLAKWRTYAKAISVVALLCTALVLLSIFRMLSIFRERDASLRLNAQLRAEAEEAAERLRGSEERQRQYAQAVIKLNAGLEKRVAERTHALRLANQELESYSYSVAHDLRTPLRMIVGFSQILRMRYGDALDAEFRRMQEDVTRAGKNMGALIDELLAMARVGQGPVERADTDLSALAQQVFDQLPAPVDKPRAAFTVAPGLTAQADATLIRAVLFNLLSNAVKYSAQNPEPRIEFGATGEGDERTYFVRDNGIGFDMAAADKLFQPFQRLHAGSQYPGMGIGLATARKIIERHGGRLWADASPGHGASFFFTLR
jgi:hypothetical protein